MKTTTRAGSVTGAFLAGWTAALAGVGIGNGLALASAAVLCGLSAVVFWFVSK